MNIGFYLDNSKIMDIDFSEYNYGNPGVGGTHYLTVYLSYLLQQYSKNDIELFLSNNQLGLPNDIYKISSLNSIIKNSNLEILVLNNGYGLSEFEPLIKLYKKRIIIWARNYFTCNQLDYLDNSSFIIAIVFVSKQQYDYYRNEKLIKKATYINHTLPYSDYIVNRSKDKIVTYMGSLTRGKGFHILADQWKKILKVHPDARLLVIGKGNLYNRQIPLGQFNLTNSNYEKRILKNITNNKKIIESVTFMGNLTYLEKKEIFNRTKIGIANPTGKTETFCLAALEFIRHGVPVVSIFDYSLPDVISHKRTGILFKNKKNLYKVVNNLLSDHQKYKYLEKNIMTDKSFDHDETVKKWDDLFSNAQRNLFEKYHFSSPKIRFKKLYVCFGLIVYKLFKVRIINYFCLKEKIVKLKNKTITFITKVL